MKIVTHKATKTGVLHSVDRSEKFVPDTNHALTKIDSDVHVTFEPGSNYKSAYRAWVASQSSDKRQNYTRKEFVRGHCSSALIEWVPGSKSCWMSERCHFWSNILMFSLCYRCALKSETGRTRYDFEKQCGNIKNYGEAYEA